MTNIYRPLIPQIVSYKELEFEHLKKKIDFTLDKDDLVDIVQAFGQSQLTVFRMTEEAKRRSATFNHCVFPEMIFAINVMQINKNYLLDINIFIIFIFVCIHIEYIFILKRIFANVIEGGKEVLKKILVNMKPGENWNLFQICLKFLQSSGNN